MDLQYIQEHWVNGMAENTEASISAWDSVAEDYVSEGISQLESDPFLQLLQQKVPLCQEMEVLDVGCGAGAYSLELAGKVGKVVGVDFSPKMIEGERRSAAKQGVENVEFLLRDWYACDGREFEGNYDVVFAHTTPAIADLATFVKMIRASKRYGLLCIPARRTDQLFDKLRKAAGIALEQRDSAVAYAFDTLWALGMNPEMFYHRTVWRSQKSLDEATQWYLGRLKESFPLEKQSEERVLTTLQDSSQDGMVEEVTHTTLVTLFWEGNP